MGILVWEALGWGNPRSTWSAKVSAGQVGLPSDGSPFDQSSLRYYLEFLNENASNKASARPLVGRLAQLIRATDTSRRSLLPAIAARDCCFDLVDIIALNTYPGLVQ